MAQYMFGTGRLTAMPLGGGAPVNFGALQNVSVDFTADIKELYGRNSFAVDVARGKVKIQGKAATGLVNVDLYNSIFFGQAPSTAGQTLVSDNEAATVSATFYTASTTAGTSAATVATITTAAAHGRQVGESVVISAATPAGYNGTYVVTAAPSATTFTYTFAGGVGAMTVQGVITSANLNAVVAQGSFFLYDMGVAYAATGLFLANVSGTGIAPLAGQYIVNAAGSYAFNAADSAKGVLATYAYNSGATGRTMAIANTLMGASPSFQIVSNGLFKGKSYTLTLFNCISNKLNLPFKQDDYALTEFDFMAFDNGAGAVGTMTATNT